MSASPCVRVVVQQADDASLCVDDGDTWVNIERGTVFYVTFLKNATKDLVSGSVDKLLKTKLHFDPLTKRKACLFDAGGSVLIIPQACLSGKIKGKGGQPQYHSQIDKVEGKVVYDHFVETFRERASAHTRRSEIIVQCGTYGECPFNQQRDRTNH
eukprot:TRINITY_DN5596_c0_g1_i2.p1 TRINITY_DN5596_c0_g1~~TRINITY_DN5596_c0_g1_i2.p1  ORF type:complete len:156 (+),score=23.79 TRINITY_DN5596_c0_g1_i2:153-620(+)